jgi:hypothetical protein
LRVWEWKSKKLERILLIFLNQQLQGPRLFATNTHPRRGLARMMPHEGEPKH